MSAREVYPLFGIIKVAAPVPGAKPFVGCDHPLTMYDPPPAQPHSPTSKAAAQAIEPHAGTMREAVYALFASRGPQGLTDEEGASLLAMSPSTYRPRRIELWRAGRIKDSGTTRHTATGRKAVVWVAS